MKVIHYTKQFKRDYKKMDRQGKNLALLDEVLNLIIDDHELPPRYQDHTLKGELKDCRECHIQGDWLLVYRKNENFISFERTGSHGELFRE